MKIKPIPLPLGDIVESLDKNCIRMARYGDGEFNCMMGKVGHTGGGWHYTPKMAGALHETLTMQGFFHCYNIKSNEVSAGNWLEKEKVDIKWYQENTILKASLDGKLSSFIKEIRHQGRKVVIVTGNAHLKRFKGFPEAKLIVVEPQKQQLLVLAKADKIIRGLVDFRTVLFSCGPLTNIFIAKMAQMKTRAINLIDIGSTWDMYVGNVSRGYARKLTHERIIELGHLNFGVDVRKWWPL
jgi:hypothetical protein